MLSVIMALISPGEECRVPNTKMPWIIPLCLLSFTPVICGTSFQQFRVGTYTYFGGGGGGVESSPLPRLQYLTVFV